MFVFMLMFMFVSTVELGLSEECGGTVRAGAVNEGTEVVERGVGDDGRTGSKGSLVKNTGTGICDGNGTGICVAGKGLIGVALMAMGGEEEGEAIRSMIEKKFSIAT